MLQTNLVENQDSELARLQSAEEALLQKYEYYIREVGGLKDLDLSLELVQIKLEIAIALIRQKRASDPARQAACFNEARRQANAAFNLYEELAKENISLDQKDFLKESPQKDVIRERMQTLLLLGGAGFFEQRLDRGRKSRLVARTLYRAIIKFEAPDDRYEPMYKTEKLPRWLRNLVLYFLPVFAKEYQKDPPYGIEEGEPEEIYHSEKIKMPLSQAIYYLEQELLPELEKKLGEQPGDKLVQKRISVATDKLREFKGIDILPRARPFVQEKGYYTDAFSGYTHEGEMLVTMNLPVTCASGTNLDRMQYYVKNEIVKNLAGKGICPELDAEYLRLKKLESGRQGSCRVPGMRINCEKWFIPLKKYVPLLQMIEDKKAFQNLIDTVTASSKKAALKSLDDMLHLKPEMLS